MTNASENPPICRQELERLQQGAAEDAERAVPAALHTLGLDAGALCRCCLPAWQPALRSGPALGSDWNFILCRNPQLPTKLSFRKQRHPDQILCACIPVSC